MLFGNKSECENARRLIEEACDNKEQKAKQRAKEYEKKKDEKRRDRQLYHMRHTHDYEELELPLGASKVYPLCVLLWKVSVPGICWCLPWWLQLMLPRFSTLATIEDACLSLFIQLSQTTAPAHCNLT